MEKVKCQGDNCNNEFETYPYLINQGYGKYCSKDCRYKAMRKTDEEKKAGNNRRAKEWRERNPDYGKSKKSKEYKKSWYEENKDIILKERKQRYQENKDKIKEYKDKNKDRISAYNKEYMKTEIARAAVRNSQYKRKLIEQDTDIDNKWLKEQKEMASYCPKCKDRMDNDGRKMYGKTIDHIISLNCGGWHKKNNVWYICRKCNLSRPKDNSDLKELLDFIVGDNYLLEQDKKALVKTIERYTDFAD